MSALPYLISSMFGIAFGSLADTVLQKRWMTTVNVRRIAQLVGKNANVAQLQGINGHVIIVPKFAAHAGSAMALICAAYAGCDRFYAVFFLISSVALSGAANSGFLVSYVDLSPNHAGMIMGAVNTLANVCGVAAPYVAGLILNNNVSVFISCMMTVDVQRKLLTTIPSANFAVISGELEDGIPPISWNFHIFFNLLRRFYIGR